ncbi:LYSINESPECIFIC HISTONE DEMETHYLASE 1C, ARABIDOPSIS LYSINE-SPECIFIC HISTONE DEMETHYLASE [Hibiscus trionum]|uniref:LYSINESPECIFIC HISTONE DEMETHYLASE 1C, ARABIDOPSIS LYSINE-SPECIFIC HISTONE DEMETHYLASE n=1 Tax=Hibiscus trionum TaxID=183268 RepID=A0A9W7M7X8_HIBTR|nr:LYSINESPECIFIC HISTONE DEMETHYLASE 1C, ARABIDOPSIS LYSINE-SPECIFIC HISTONE DEMETHYLASE [Hibiscus trionum]
MEPPQDTSENLNDVVSDDDSSPENTNPEDHENPSTTLDPHISDTQDESSDPVADQQPQNTNSNPADPGPPVRRRRRRKRFFTELIANSSLSKNRRPRVSGLAKEMDTEALIAVSVGFPVDSLTEEEIEANVVSRIGGQEQANYIVVRNHILARWRSNVSDWLTREHALAAIRAEHKNLVDAAYNFLLEHGYINFGLSPAVKEAKLKSFDGVERANVVIVGAGLSGLVAARQLVSMGFKVVILEGRTRPGGRVKTRKMKGDGVVAAADLGGSVLTGINGNPFGVLARQMGLPLHKVRDICPLYLPDGKAVDADVDSRIEVSFNKLLDRVCKLRHSMIEEVKSVDVPLGTALEAFRNVYKVAEDSQESMLLNWHLANLEYANASLMSNLSMAYWDQDDPYEMGGDHCFIPGGNERFVRALAEDLPIFYGRTVQSVRYGVDGVRVYAGGQEFCGDMALCTVPLGVLKAGSIEFVPELPQRKNDAIQRLGFGLLNKVAMLFPYNFWGGDIDTFGHLTEDPSMRGQFFLFYSYSAMSGGPLLVALVAGDAAIKFELMSPVESVKRVLHILRGIFHPKGIVVPDPVQAVCTRWGKDRFTYGSYSHVAIGSSGDDYDILAESVGDDRVFFAGEATNKQYPATMHGAFLSGMREAANMLRVERRRSLNLSNKVSNDFEKCDSLNQLFENPDLTFGSFSALYDPHSDDIGSHALIRVKFQGDKLDSGHLCLYGLMTKKQIIQLSEVNGDGNRMNMLHRNFGVKLVGRKGLSNIGESLISRIKAAKFNQNAGEKT